MISQSEKNFQRVSEAAGVRVTREAVDMLYTRYSVAADLAKGKDVLEVSCGPGHGLGLLAKQARYLVGGDYQHEFVQAALAQYEGQIPVLRLDAQNLPFRDGSFDLIVMLEAIYYIPDVHRFLSECRRVLRQGGKLFICTANKEWSEFNPSPFSTAYYGSAELEQLLRLHGFSSEVFGGFRTSKRGTISYITRTARRVAVRLNLIPKTMHGKEVLKRIFYGKLQTLNGEVREDTGSRHPLLRLENGQSCPDYKVLYAVARI